MIPFRAPCAHLNLTSTGHTTLSRHDKTTAFPLGPYRRQSYNSFPTAAMAERTRHKTPAGGEQPALPQEAQSTPRPPPCPAATRAHRAGTTEPSLCAGPAHAQHLRRLDHGRLRQCETNGAGNVSRCGGRMYVLRDPITLVTCAPC